MPNVETLLLVFAVFTAAYLFRPAIVVRNRGIFLVGGFVWIGLSALLNSPHLYFYGAVLYAAALETELIVAPNAVGVKWIPRRHIPLIFVLLVWSASWAFDPANFGLWSRSCLLVLVLASGVLEIIVQRRESQPIDS
jgi:hypothetical protein